MNRRASRVRPVETSSISINFGCGFLFGVVAGAGAFAYTGEMVPALVVGLIAGLLSALFGEKFWSSIAGLFTWL
jgi:hypothetical protein